MGKVKALVLVLLLSSCGTSVKKNLSHECNWYSPIAIPETAYREAKHPETYYMLEQVDIYNRIVTSRCSGGQSH